MAGVGRWISAILWLVIRLIGQVVALVVVGMVLGFPIGFFADGGWHGAIRGAIAGIKISLVIGGVFFLWGIWIAIRNALRGDYRRLREEAQAERLAQIPKSTYGTVPTTTYAEDRPSLEELLNQRQAPDNAHPQRPSSHGKKKISDGE
jgi:uncharacterized membrane protein